MNSEMMYQMFAGMIDKMSDAELENALSRVKSMISPEDFEKLVKMIAEKRQK